MHTYGLWFRCLKTVHIESSPQPQRTHPETQFMYSEAKVLPEHKRLGLPPWPQGPGQSGELGSEDVGQRSEFRGGAGQSQIQGCEVGQVEGQCWGWEVGWAKGKVQQEVVTFALSMKCRISVLLEGFRYPGTDVN